VPDHGAESLSPLACAPPRFRRTLSKASAPTVSHAASALNGPTGRVNAQPPLELFGGVPLLAGTPPLEATAHACGARAKTGSEDACDPGSGLVVDLVEHARNHQAIAQIGRDGANDVINRNHEAVGSSVRCQARCSSTSTGLSRSFACCSFGRCAKRASACTRLRAREPPTSKGAKHCSSTS